jgi:hypothetical protein
MGQPQMRATPDEPAELRVNLSDLDRQFRLH